LAQADLLLEALRWLFNSYSKLGLNHPLSLDELVAIYQPEKWLREWLFNSSEVLKNLPLDKETVLKMVQLPAGSQNFFDAHSTVKARKQQSGIPLSCFIVEDGTIEYEESIDSYIAGRVETRTQSEEQEQLYEELLAVFTTLSEIKAKYGKLQLVGSNMSEAVIDQYMGQITFNPLPIKKI
jgi:hypothetical protein